MSRSFKNKRTHQKQQVKEIQKELKLVGDDPEIAALEEFKQLTEVKHLMRAKVFRKGYGKRYF